MRRLVWTEVTEGLRPGISDYWSCLLAVLCRTSSHAGDLSSYKWRTESGSFEYLYSSTQWAMEFEPPEEAILRVEQKLMTLYPVEFLLLSTSAQETP